MSPTQKLSLDLMVAELAQAVRTRDTDRILELQQAILQGLAEAAAECAALERRVRALMTEFEDAKSAPPSITIDSFDLERGSSDGVVYPVWFGTSRRPTSDKLGFSGERSDRVVYGRVEVQIPHAHRFGETGTPFWKRLLRFNISDDRLKMLDMQVLEPDAFMADLRGVMNAAVESGEEPHGLVFLHGYNVGFEEAAIRAAQIGYDLKVIGATAFFSWPSRGSAIAYPVDEAAIEASEKAIKNFLVDFATKSGARKLHVIAHSMGNRGFLRALQRIAADANTSGKIQFGQIVLAAPDIDRDLFLDLAYLYAQHGERTTLYISNADRPVHLSSKLHDAPRAGYFEPYTVAPSIDTITVPNFDLDLLGHSYFSQAEAILHDIYDLIRNNESPGRRQRIEVFSTGDANFWSLRR
ncbi:hypothetical protein A3862_24340 [Methylobacterium sp. XJLW]|uniref:alpha/beta hydrolase n=1 Tax=Methylobacterium sp. XJLW TaxID=739141 RepID=UPI000DAAFA37|nr:alpha/beta hydrolase [Methylobacterium sp. XJLW]AWV18255.1 hypothetical protein A3862_24340 [Methylobacterium sp. XJLW]